MIWGATARIVGDLLARIDPVLDGAGPVAAGGRWGASSFSRACARASRTSACSPPSPRSRASCSSRPPLQRFAYSDRPLPIGGGQTISQPSLVARMCELLELRDDDVVLDVGTGSGYHAALLSRLCRHVYGVELDAQLAAQAARSLGWRGSRT